MKAIPDLEDHFNIFNVCQIWVLKLFGLVDVSAKPKYYLKKKKPTRKSAEV